MAVPQLDLSRFYHPMSGRDPDEEHRTSTPLELFFDLCFVVAIAFAASGLHHSLIDDHAWDGLRDYAFVFFAIWWAWMNFTWFASAYDTDDVPYRIVTMVQIAGALILAAGVPRAMENGDFELVTWGYVVMRLALVTQWLRAAHDDPPRRTTALRFAIGVTIVQCLWVARLWTNDLIYVSFVVLAIADVLVPVWSERASTGTRWHPEHIAERYGLFTIIVLGEAVLAATIAFQVALDAGGGDFELLTLCIASVLTIFSMWWLYFDHPPDDDLTSTMRAFLWGYGHYFIFGAIAAAGVGIEVAVDYSVGASELSERATGFAISMPVAVYVVGIWALHLLRHMRGPLNAAFPLAAVLIVGAGLTPIPVHMVAAILVALLAAVILEAPHTERHATHVDH